MNNWVDKISKREKQRLDAIERKYLEYHIYSSYNENPRSEKAIADGQEVFDTYPILSTARFAL